MSPTSIEDILFSLQDKDSGVNIDLALAQIKACLVERVKQLGNENYADDIGEEGIGYREALMDIIKAIEEALK